MQRTLKVEEVVDAITFIASEKASFVTGVNMLLDGGFTKA